MAPYQLDPDFESAIRDQPLERLFEKKLSPTDISGKFAFPSELRDQVWSKRDPHGTKQVIRVADRYGRRGWEFEGRLRVDKQGLKSEVSGPDWCGFLREKGLNEGDYLVFYKSLNRREADFVVTVRRLEDIRLFGKDIRGPAVDE